MIRTLTEAEIDATVAALTADLDALPVAARVVPDLAPGVRVLTAAQAQGDVLIIPTAQDMPHWAQPLPTNRPVTVVFEGNGHQLRALTRHAGRVLWAPINTDPHLIAVVEVTVDAALLLEHAGKSEHDVLGFGPGRYEVRRQREKVPVRPVRWDPFADPSGRTLGISAAIFAAAASVVVVD